MTLRQVLSIALFLPFCFQPWLDTIHPWLFWHPQLLSLRLQTVCLNIQENINAVRQIQLSDKEMEQMRSLNKEQRFYLFNLEMTRRFCSNPLPDAANNDEWQKKMNDELDK